MRRFFVPATQWGEFITFPADEARHATQVLRMKSGDRAVIFDGAGHEVEVLLDSCTRHRVQAVATGGVRTVISRPRLVLGQGLARGDKLSYLIQHAVELGLSEFYPLVLSRSVARVAEERASGRLERWTRIAIEAAKQCRRADVPRLHPPGSLKEFCAHFEAQGPARKGVVLYEEASSERTLRSVLEKWDAPDEAGIWILVGSEGGLEPEEVLCATRAGFETVSLGSRILRTEIAGLSVLAVLQYLWGEQTQDPNPTSGAGAAVHALPESS